MQQVRPGPQLFAPVPRAPPSCPCCRAQSPPVQCQMHLGLSEAMMRPASMQWGGGVTRNWSLLWACCMGCSDCCTQTDVAHDGDVELVALQRALSDFRNKLTQRHCCVQCNAQPLWGPCNQTKNGTPGNILQSQISLPCRGWHGWRE